MPASSAAEIVDTLTTSRENTTGRWSAVRTRSRTTTGSPGRRSSAAASPSLAASVCTAVSDVPGSMPAARIASVTPKFTSRLFLQPRAVGRVRARSARPRHEPVLLERTEGLAEGRAGDAELLGEGRLRRQLGASGDTTGVDAIRDLVAHPER
jgi:hypothetical protein